jgi:hypothetical protein
MENLLREIFFFVQDYREQFRLRELILLIHDRYRLNWKHPRIFLNHDRDIVKQKMLNPFQ